MLLPAEKELIFPISLDFPGFFKKSLRFPRAHKRKKPTSFPKSEFPMKSLEIWGGAEGT